VKRILASKVLPVSLRIIAIALPVSPLDAVSGGKYLLYSPFLSVGQGLYKETGCVGYAEMC